MYIKWRVTKLKAIGSRWPGQTSHRATLVQSQRTAGKVNKVVICHLGTVQHKTDRSGLGSSAQIKFNVLMAMIIWQVISVEKGGDLDIST